MQNINKADNIKEKLLKTKQIIQALQKAAKRYDEYNTNDDVADNNELGEGFSETDEDGKEDAAAKWLKDQEKSSKNKSDLTDETVSTGETAPEEVTSEDEEEKDVKKRFPTEEWKPSAEYNAKQRGDVNSFLAQGYAHREAERLSGLEKEHKDYNSALKSKIAPSMMSEKMLQMLKPLAAEAVSKKEVLDNKKADPRKNPVKYAAGKIQEDHEKRLPNFAKDFQDFLNSPETKALKGIDRHRAGVAFKKDWHEKNNAAQAASSTQAAPVAASATPQEEYDKQYGSPTQDDESFKNEVAAPSAPTQAAPSTPKVDHLTAAKQAAKEYRDETLAHIRSGGAVPTNMSTEAGLQHAGGGRDQEGAPQANIVNDRTTSFASHNPALVNMLSQEQLKRKQNIDTAKATQKPTVIRRAAPQGKE